MDYREYVEDKTQHVEEEVKEVMLVEDVTFMLDVIESQLRIAVGGLMRIEGLSEIDEAKTNLADILDDLY